jgi:hypothetical protein
VDTHIGRSCHISRSHSFEDQSSIESAHACTSVLRIAVDRRETKLGGFDEDILREVALTVPLSGKRSDVLLGEVEGCVIDSCFFLIKPSGV